MIGAVCCYGNDISRDTPGPPEPSSDGPRYFRPVKPIFYININIIDQRLKGRLHRLLHMMDGLPRPTQVPLFRLETGSRIINQPMESQTYRVRDWVSLVPGYLTEPACFTNPTKRVGRLAVSF